MFAAERAGIQLDVMPEALKSYRVPWEGPTVLACRKCQKKLKKDTLMKPLASLRKTAKKRSKLFGEAKIHIVDVGCMDLCPRNAVAICKPAETGDRLYILRSEDDLSRL